MRTLAAIEAKFVISVLRTLTILSAVLAIAPAASAAILFGTTTSGTLDYNPFSVSIFISDGFNPNLPAWIWNTGGIEFSPPSGVWTLDSLTVPLRAPVISVPVTFTLYSGTSRPETPLATSTLTLPESTGFSLDTFTFSTAPQIQGGQNYFLIGTTPQSTTQGNQVDWAGDNNGVSTPFFFGQTWLTGQFGGFGFLGWNSFTSGVAWQVALDPVPEPGSIFLISLGLAGLLVRARKKNKSSHSRIFYMTFSLVKRVFLFAAFFAANPAWATTQFGTTINSTLAYTSDTITLAGANTFNSGLNRWISSFDGIEFQLPGSGFYQLDDFTAALAAFPTVPVTFTLYSGNLFPSTVLATSTLSTFPTPDSLGFSLDTFTFSTHPILQGGNHYFLIASVPQSTTDTSELDWAGNPAGTRTNWETGQTWLGAGGGFRGWNNTTADVAWQMDVDPLPEPASFLFMGAGLVALAAIRRKKIL